MQLHRPPAVPILRTASSVGTNAHVLLPLWPSVWGVRSPQHDGRSSGKAGDADELRQRLCSCRSSAFTQLGGCGFPTGAGLVRATQGLARVAAQGARGGAEAFGCGMTELFHTPREPTWTLEGNG